MTKAFRIDSRPLTADFVPMQEAEKALVGEDRSTEADKARTRMLARMGLKGDTGSAEDARRRMIQRGGKK